MPHNSQELFNMKVSKPYFFYSLIAVCILIGGYSFLGKDFNQGDLLPKRDSHAKLLSKEENEISITTQTAINESLKSEPIKPATSFIETHNLKLSQAKEGDSNAQYELALILGKCNWDSKPAELEIEQTIDTLIASNSELDEAYFDGLRKSARDCAPIYDLYEGQLLYNVRNAWIYESAEQGNEYALLSLAFREVDRFTDQKYKTHVKLLVENAMKTALQDKSMMEHALSHAISYRVNMHSIDDGIDLASKQTSDWALRLAECQFIQSGKQGCIKNFQTEHELSQHYFLDPELAQSKSKAKTLIDSISEKESLADFDIDTF